MPPPLQPSSRIHMKSFLLPPNSEHINHLAQNTPWNPYLCDREGTGSRPGALDKTLTHSLRRSCRRRPYRHGPACGRHACRHRNTRADRGPAGAELRGAPRLLEGSTLKSSLPTSIDHTDESRFRSWRPSQLDEIRLRAATSIPITTRRSSSPAGPSPQQLVVMVYVEHDYQLVALEDDRQVGTTEATQIRFDQLRNLQSLDFICGHIASDEMRPSRHCGTRYSMVHTASSSKAHQERITDKV